MARWPTGGRPRCTARREGSLFGGAHDDVLLWRVVLSTRFIAIEEGLGSRVAGGAALLTPLSPKWQRGCLRHHVGVAEAMCVLPYFLGRNVSLQARGGLRGDSCGTPSRRAGASGGSPEARDPLRPSFPLHALEGNCLSRVPPGGDAWSLVVSSDWPACEAWGEWALHTPVPTGPTDVYMNNTNPILRATIF